MHEMDKGPDPEEIRIRTPLSTVGGIINNFAHGSQVIDDQLRDGGIDGETRPILIGISAIYVGISILVGYGVVTEDRDRILQIMHQCAIEAQERGELSPSILEEALLAITNQGDPS